MDFKKIKGLFVQDVPEEKTEKKSEDILDVLKNKNETPKVEVNQKILDSLVKSMEKNNLPGEDYLEFVKALQAMENIPIDESVKIQTVLATLSTKGLTVDKIVESSKFYLDVLSKEKDKFGVAHQKQIKDGVESKKSEISSYEELNKVKLQQIEQLKADITKNEEEIKKLNQLIVDNQQKIDNTENEFNSTYEFMVKQIQDRINKIK